MGLNPLSLAGGAIPGADPSADPFGADAGRPPGGGDGGISPFPSPVGTGPDPHALRSLAPGERDAHEVVLIDTPPAMTEDDLAAAFQAIRTEASAYNDQLGQARDAAMKVYNAEPMGDEEPGRSSVVMSDVRDAVSATMPTVLRIFAGAERPVLFTPTAEGDEDQAEQATEYVHFVVFDECNGFRAIYDSAMDALQLKIGWIHWWWDSAVGVHTERYFGLLEPQCSALITQPGVRAMRVVRRPATEEEREGLAASPEGALVHPIPGQPIMLFDATITRRVAKNAPCLGAIPGEQVWIDPDASGPEDARGIFIVRVLPVSDLVALGFDEAELLDYAEATAPADDKIARRRDKLAAQATRNVSPDPALRRITLTDGWIRVDYDGDGIAELRRVRAVGAQGEHIIAHEGASHIPMAPIVPFPIPHRSVGNSYADIVGDLQAVSTRVVRNILDSMAESIHPRTVIKDTAVVVADVMNTEMGAVIRERETGAVRELTKPFVGPAALPILEMLNAVKEARTGITRASQGLNAEALQSTTQMAVAAQVSAAQDRLELVMRCIAEGIKPLYAGILALMCEHQDRPRLARLRNKWVPVDPRPWMARFNVTVNPAVSAGSMAERMQVLGAIAAKQESILQTMGPSNPLVSLGQYRATLADMLLAAQIRNAGRYFQDIPLNFQIPQPPKQPTPDELLAQVEVEKANQKSATDAADRRATVLQNLLADDLDRDKARADAMLRAADLMGQYPHIQLDMLSLGAMFQRPVDATVAMMAMARGDAVQPGGPPGAPPEMPPPLPPPGQAGPGGSLANAQAFMPPKLIEALAAAQRAGAAAPQLPTQPAA